MAGEWLKFDSTLPEKQETLAITVAMGWDDPDLTVGKLMRLFRWFDQHTIDGNAGSVTPALLDRIVGVSGFVTAVAAQGWIVIAESGISLHNFDRHNGATAKSRALTAKRVANHKANAVGNGDGNADSVSDALPREEKRREESSLRSDQSISAKYPEAFLLAWAAYPKRPGASKADSLKAWNARVKAGATPEAILAGVQRYAAFCATSGTAPSFIKQPATFFGPGEHYLSDWTPSTAPTGGGTIHDRRAATHAGLTKRANHANSDERTFDVQAHVVG